MKRIALVSLGIVLLAGCGRAPAPVAAKPDAKAVELANLQPRLQPPPQVLVAAPVVRKAAAETAAPAPKPDPNAMLADRVKQALEDESRIHAAAIDVTASAGTVTLWGTATSDDERARATRVAARIAGVKWVNNKLVIAAGS